MFRRDFLKSAIALVLAPIPTIKKVIVKPWFRGSPHTIKFDLKGLPLPIISKDFSFGVKELASIRRKLDIEHTNLMVEKANDFERELVSSGVRPDNRRESGGNPFLNSEAWESMDSQKPT